MSKGIRIFLIIVALACIPALIFPELGVSQSPASPLAILIISGLLAILWPGPRVKTAKLPIAPEQQASQRGVTESGRSLAYETEAEMSTTQSGFIKRKESGFQRKDAA